MKIETPVWATSDNSLVRLLSGSLSTEQLLGDVTFSAHDMSDYWTKVGTATIDMTLDLTNSRQQAVDAIDKRIRDLDAETGRKKTELLALRNKLLAIENGSGA
jgi:hypothetical protein